LFKKSNNEIVKTANESYCLPYCQQLNNLCARKFKKNDQVWSIKTEFSFTNNAKPRTSNITQKNYSS